MSTQSPVEDISAVVSRFHAWAGTHVPTPARESVRELTYEEAVQSMRSRVGYAAFVPEVEPIPDVSAAINPDSPVETDTVPLPQSVSRPAMTAVEPKSFRQILSDNVSLSPAALPQATTAMQRKSAAVSVRVSSSELALLKRRAAEADLSLSSYVRHCALEVESLRAQLADALTTQKHESFASGCVRFVRRLFTKKTTALALRV